MIGISFYLTNYGEHSIERQLKYNKTQTCMAGYLSNVDSGFYCYVDAASILSIFYIFYFISHTIYVLFICKLNIP